MQPIAEAPAAVVPTPADLQPRTSSLAIISLVCGILGFLVGFTAVVAIITGHMARSEIRRRPWVRGDGIALAGLILGYIGVVAFAVALAVFGWWLWLGPGFGH